MSAPLSPTGVAGTGGTINADGTTLKVAAPLAVYPLADATSIPVDTTLTSTQSKGLYADTPFAHRFQVSDTDTFAALLANDMGAIDSQGLVRFGVSPSLAAAKKVYWRVRAESADKVGPWSNTLSFTTAGATTSVPPTGGGGSTTTGPRPADPPAGARLPLPDARPAISRAQGRLSTLASCPNGRKYENNPWQDAMIDDLRTSDARWAYNGKPTRTSADNGGFPVIAAGDEIAYHYGAGADQNSREVYLIDTLLTHCGANPTTTYRDFTGEEPGFWTTAGRFQGGGQ